MTGLTSRMKILLLVLLMISIASPAGIFAQQRQPAGETEAKIKNAAEFTTYVTGGLPPDRPEIFGLVLLAVSHGLGSLALDTGPQWEHMYTEAAGMAFDRITAPPIAQGG